MRTSVLLMAIWVSTLIVCSCTNETTDVPVMGIDFEWQPVDYGSHENPEIALTGVPEGTVRFRVSLVDLDMKSYDHGGGIVENDGTGIINRGSIEGNYQGPSPYTPTMIHNYEISVEALDAEDKVIGIGKTAKEFTCGRAE